MTVRYLEFSAEELRPLIEHSAKSERHQIPYGAEESSPSMMLVHDQGVYLMSAGVPGMLAKGNWEEYHEAKARRKAGEDVELPSLRHRVAYAKGMDPYAEDDDRNDDDWWDVARSVVGGDDFVVFLELSWFTSILEDDQDNRPVFIPIVDGYIYKPKRERS